MMMICQDRLGTDEHKRRRTQQNTRWFCAGDDGDDAGAAGRDTGCPDTEEAGWCSRIPSVAEVRKTICNWDTAAACAMTHDHLSRQARDKQKEKGKDSSGTGTQNALICFAKPHTQVRARLESSNPPLLPVFAIAGEDPLGICGGAGTAV